MLKAAKILIIAWAIFWFLFGLLSGIGEKLLFLGVVMHTIVPGGIFLVSAWLAIKKYYAGGILLICVAVGSFAFFVLPGILRGGFLRVLPTMLVLVLPPVFSGIVLVVNKSKNKSSLTPLFKRGE